MSKEEFDAFLEAYPNKLEKDYYMDWYSWNDFSDGKVWPESVVAMMWPDGWYHQPAKYKILDE